VTQPTERRVAERDRRGDHHDFNAAISSAVDYWQEESTGERRTATVDRRKVDWHARYDTLLAVSKGIDAFVRRHGNARCIQFIEEQFSALEKTNG